MNARCRRVPQEVERSCTRHQRIAAPTFPPITIVLSSPALFLLSSLRYVVTTTLPETPPLSMQVVSHPPEPGGSFMLSTLLYADTVKHSALVLNVFNDPVRSDV